MFLLFTSVEEPSQLMELTHADRQRRLAEKVNSIFHTEVSYIWPKLFSDLLI